MKPDDHDSEQARAAIFSLSIKYRETPRHHEKVQRDQIMGHGRLSEISRNIIDIGIGMIRSIRA